MFRTAVRRDMKTTINLMGTVRESTLSASYFHFDTLVFYLTIQYRANKVPNLQFDRESDAFDYESDSPDCFDITSDNRIKLTFYTILNQKY